MSVVGRGEAGRLTPKTLAVLLLLADRPGKIVTRAGLIAGAWPDSQPTDDALSYVVRELRRALGDDARAPRVIETVHGVGYRMMVEVVKEDESDETVPTGDAATPPQASGGLGRRSRGAWFAGAALGALAVLVSAQLYTSRAIEEARALSGLAEPPVFVTSDAGTEEHPALSPDGAFVAYAGRAAPQGSSDIWIKSVVGPDARAVALTNTPDVSELWPSWSPDGRWIAFQAHLSPGFAIMISAASGGEPRRLASLNGMVVGRMDWSADGRQLLSSLPSGSGPRLHVIDVQDGSVRPLRHDLDGSGWDLDPTYSPDGTWIAFRHGLSPTWDLYVIPAGGGVARRLTNLGAVRGGHFWLTIIL